MKVVPPEEVDAMDISDDDIDPEQLANIGISVVLARARVRVRLEVKVRVRGGRDEGEDNGEHEG